MVTLKPNATGDRWNKIVTEDKPFMGMVSIGNSTVLTIGMFHHGIWLFVGVEGHGAYRFSHYVHRSYAEEKLGVSIFDSGNVADFINAQLGLDLTRYAGDQGHYESRYCV